MPTRLLEKSSGIPLFIDYVKTCYSKFLLDPEKALEIIQRNNASLFFNKALEVFPPSQQDLKDSTFPETVIKGICAKMQGKLDKIIETCRLSGEEIDLISGNIAAKFPDQKLNDLKRQIEPLIRMKSWS